MSNKTDKRIAELQAVVDGLKAEEAALKTRLSEAEFALHEAQREIKINTKPTPAMLSVLALMALTGEPIHRNRYRFSFYTSDAEGRTVKVRDSVFFGLVNREAIARDERDSFTLTDHGRALLARWAKPQAADTNEGT